MVMGEAAGLRRRRGRTEQATDAARRNTNQQENNPNDSLLDPPPRQQRPQQPPQPRRRRRQHAQQDSATTARNMTKVYCRISAVLALLAIVLAPQQTITTKTTGNSPTHAHDYHQQQQYGDASGSVFFHESQEQNLKGEGKNDPWEWILNILGITHEEEDEIDKKRNHKHHQPQQPPVWLRWLGNNHHHHHDQERRKQQHEQEEAPTRPGLLGLYSMNDLIPFLGNFSPVSYLTSLLVRVVDPVLVYPGPGTLTDLIDKVLTSTERLLAIANLLLALTYLLHITIADWFLGIPTNNTTINTNNNNRRHIPTNNPSAEWVAASGRERLGGFLVFKLLLISAVVSPDTLDLLILLSWYTLLSFLRSLSHLCASMTQHTSQSGQGPRPGVLKLLLVVLLCDCLAASVCVGLFHGAGIGMVLLLTCDCAILAVDVIGHVLEHTAQVLEGQHASRVSALEEEQLQIHQRQEESRSTMTVDTDGDDEQERSRELDRRLESLENNHTRRLAVLDTSVFVLQLVTHVLTVGHFLHIWSLHGVQFTLIDGVLTLHLHSALSSVSKKIAERRNLYRIARDLDGAFENASEMDLHKAAAAGDVCCICLGGMTTGNVKKVGCGHLFHSSCLREVVERARSMEAARCPLCRASVMTGRQPGGGQTEGRGLQRQENATGTGANEDADQEDARLFRFSNNNQGDGPLFRFSTEEVVPQWVPLPSFSFEVMRRPSAAQDPPARPVPPNVNNQENARSPNEPQVPPPQERQSRLRRWLVLAGIAPMSPEEEAAALEQLVDMFPQYDRGDLLRELRNRGSAEGVAESVLSGSFRATVVAGAFADGVEQEAS